MGGMPSEVRSAELAVEAADVGMKFIRRAACARRSGDATPPLALQHT